MSTAMVAISFLTLGLDDAFCIAASAAEADGPHADLLDRQAIQRLGDEPHKKIYTTQEVNKCSGEQLQRWQLAAEAEYTKNFIGQSAFHISTEEEIRQHGRRPLPMLCVWSMSDDVAKCRACVCGNFSQVDPTEQSWTAQAEPSSLMASLKLGRKKNWTISKHDVKGAFLNAKVPEGKVIIVSPPPSMGGLGIGRQGCPVDP